MKEVIKLEIEKLDERDDLCRSCMSEEVKVWRVFKFSNGSVIVCYEICGVCCVNMYKWNDKWYINVKRYGFEKNDFREVDKEGNEV